jgi:hypothetical protein
LSSILLDTVLAASNLIPSHRILLFITDSPIESKLKLGKGSGSAVRLRLKVNEELRKDRKRERKAK